MIFCRNIIIPLIIFYIILISGTASVPLAAASPANVSQALPQKSPYLQLTEITQIDKMISLFEKMIFLREKEGPESGPQRMTWEGILSSDSAGRSACKKLCLNNYGIHAKDPIGNDCDDRGWNLCMQLMDWGIFHWHRSCKGDHKKECEACWMRQTQVCYDAEFVRCLDLCPE